MSKACLVYLYNLWFIVVAINAIFSQQGLVWLITLLVAKIIIELIYLYPVSVFFNKEKLLWWFPIAQPFHIFYTIIAGWLVRFGSYEWKGRSVK